MSLRKTAVLSSMVVLLFACDNSESSQTQIEEEEVSAAEDTDVSATDETETEDNENESSDNQGQSELVFYGNEAVVDDLSIKVNSFDDTQEIVINDFSVFTPDDGKYAIINVTLNNTGSQAISFDNGMFDLTYDEADYSSVTLLGADSDYISYESLNPGISKTGNLVFNLPDDVNTEESILLYYGDDYFGENDPIEFKLR